MTDDRLSISYNSSADGMLAVYEVFHSKGTHEIARSTADNLGIKGEIQSQEGIHLLAVGPQRLAVYEETGTIWYSDTEKIDNETYEAELPSRKEAKKMATAFLRKHGWLPDNYVADSVVKGQSERIEGHDKRKRTASETHICVNFRPRIGEVETYGPGAKIKVFLGHKGEVIGLFRADAETKRYARYPVVPQEEVEKTLTRKLGQALDKFKPTSARLIYHAESSVSATRFLQPAYLFEFETEVESRKSGEKVTVPFEVRPIPATRFAPIVVINAARRDMEIVRGKRLQLRCEIEGGTEPYDIRWHSDFDGEIGSGSVLERAELSVAHRQGRIIPHVISVTVTDRNGMSDADMIWVTVKPKSAKESLPPRDGEKGPDPYVGVEWCNVYGSPGLSNISGTDDSAKGFKNGIAALPGWSSRFDWGNGAAWEQDFKVTGAPGGGTDTFWADNVHFAFFAGHGSSGRFWFGSTVDDHEMRAQDAEWGDGHLNWIVLHACQTMRANFEWDVWCDAFNGLHQMFGFHTNTQGSTPPLGTRFALWSSFRMWPLTDSIFTLREAWRIACQECYDASREYSMIYAGESGTDTASDHLAGYGFVSADPTNPNYWVYSRGTC